MRDSVMYCINGASCSFLLIEFTNSIIKDIISKGELRPLCSNLPSMVVVRRESSFFQEFQSSTESKCPLAVQCHSGRESVEGHYVLLRRLSWLLVSVVEARSLEYDISANIEEGVERALD